MHFGQNGPSEVVAFRLVLNGRTRRFFVVFAATTKLFQFLFRREISDLKAFIKMQKYPFAKKKSTSTIAHVLRFAKATQPITPTP